MKDFITKTIKGDMSKFLIKKGHINSEGDPDLLLNKTPVIDYKQYRYSVVRCLNSDEESLLEEANTGGYLTIVGEVIGGRYVWGNDNHKMDYERSRKVGSFREENESFHYYMQGLFS